MMQNQKDVDFDEDEGEMLPLLCWSHEDRSKTKTLDQEGPPKCQPRKYSLVCKDKREDFKNCSSASRRRHLFWKSKRGDIFIPTDICFLGPEVTEPFTAIAFKLTMCVSKYIWYRDGLWFSESTKLTLVKLRYLTPWQIGKLESLSNWERNKTGVLIFQDV